MEQAAWRHARGVDHPVEGAEPAARQADGAAHRLLVGNVGGDGENLGSQLLQGFEAADSAAHRVRLATAGQPGGPLALRRQLGATHQRQAGPRLARQVLGEGEPHAAETTGDQIDALPPQAAALGLLQAQRLEALDPAVAAAQGHQRGGRRGEELAEQQVRKLSRPVCAGPQVDVDAAAAQVGVLLRDHPAGADEGRLLRPEQVTADHRLHVARYHVQQHRLGAAAPAQRLGEEEQALESLGRGLPHVPEVENALRPTASREGLGEQSLVVRAPPRIDGEGTLARAAEAPSRGDPHDLPPLAFEPPGDLLAETGRIEEGEPALVIRPRLRGGEEPRRPGARPARQMEPVGEAAARRLALRLGATLPFLDPVAPALERIGGQRHPLPAAAVLKAAQSTATPASQRRPRALSSAAIVRPVVARMRAWRRAPHARRRGPDAAGPGWSAPARGPPPAAPRRARASSVATPLAKRTVWRRCRAQ